MKKALLFSVTVFLFVVVSCSKSYTCNCTDGSPNIVYTEEIESDNLDDARSQCHAKGIECSLEE